MKKIKSFEELNWFRKKSEDPKHYTESDINVRKAFESIKSTFKLEKLSFSVNKDNDDDVRYREFTYKITETYSFVLSRTSNFELFSYRTPNKYSIRIGSKTVDCSDGLCEEMFEFFRDEYNKKKKK